MRKGTEKKMNKETEKKMNKEAGKKMWVVEYVDGEDFVLCNSELSAYRHALTKYADLILDSLDDNDFSKELIANDLLALVKTKSFEDFAYIREVEVYEG